MFVSDVSGYTKKNFADASLTKKAKNRKAALIQKRLSFTY